MTFVWECFPECLVLGVLFDGHLIMLEEETRGRKMDFQNNIPSGCEEQRIFLADNALFFALLVFFPLSLSLSVTGSMIMKETFVLITSVLCVRMMRFVVFELVKIWSQSTNDANFTIYICSCQLKTMHLSI